MRFSLLFFTLRVLWKNRLFTLLNVFGLTFGLAASIWLAMYLKNELTYDQHHVNHERVYRLSHLFKSTAVEFNTASSASELPGLMKEEFPEIVETVRFMRAGLREMEYNNQVFTEEKMFFADPGVFDLFTHEFLAGDPATALKGPGFAVITRSINNKLFGDRLGINEIVKFNDQDFKITGIVEDLPTNSHFTFEVLLSEVPERNWGGPEQGEFNSELLWNTNCFIYVLVNEGFNQEQFMEKFGSFDERYFVPFSKIAQATHTFRMQQLADIHYATEMLDDDLPKGNAANLMAFTAIGLAILLLACINYINLSTASAGLRAKEIGIRKALGSNVASLRVSILSESLVQVVIALLLAVLSVWAVVTYTPFQSWLGTTFEFDLFQQLDLMAVILLLVLLTGFVSGLYPAFYLSSIQTVKALKGNWRAAHNGGWVRQGLVLFQFVISIGVLSATLLMKDQISFLQTKDLGFAKDQILVLNTNDSIKQARTKALKDLILQSPSIEGASSSWNVPGVDIGTMVFRVKTADGEMMPQEFKYIQCGPDYLETMQIPLKEGEFFREGETRGNAYFVVNETAAKAIGWDEPVGQKMGFFHQDDPGQVIGVVQDFNFFSLHNPIEPMVFVYNPNPGGRLIVRYKSGNEREALDHIKSSWASVLPDQQPDITFLNQTLHEQYDADQDQNQLISAMTILCVIISLIGLSGLSAFTVNQRSKEIGVRKVLGAMSIQIIKMVFSGTMKLVLLATLIAIPLTYLIISRWSTNFAYQAGFNVVLVGLAVVLSLVLTFIIVGGHTWRTARKNPSDTLRYE